MLTDYGLSFGDTSYNYQEHMSKWLDGMDMDDQGSGNITEQGPENKDFMLWSTTKPHIDYGGTLPTKPLFGDVSSCIGAFDSFPDDKTFNDSSFDERQSLSHDELKVHETGEMFTKSWYDNILFHRQVSMPSPIMPRVVTDHLATPLSSLTSEFKLDANLVGLNDDDLKGPSSYGRTIFTADFGWIATLDATDHFPQPVEPELSIVPQNETIQASAHLSITTHTADELFNTIKMIASCPGGALTAVMTTVDAAANRGVTADSTAVHARVSMVAVQRGRGGRRPKPKGKQKNPRKGVKKFPIEVTKAFVRIMVLEAKHQGKALPRVKVPSEQEMRKYAAALELTRKQFKKKWDNERRKKSNAFLVD